MDSVRVEDRVLARRVRQVRIDFYGEFGVGEVAETLGLPAETWENYEAGVRMPATTLLAFISVTGASPHWLLTGRGPRYAAE
jgi:hypothetical protein